MEGLIGLDSTRSAAAINRLVGEPTDSSALSDFLTYSPWSEAEVRDGALRYMVPWITRAHLPEDIPVLISIDDSLAKKPKESKHFEGVEWHFEANGERRYGHGFVFVDCHMQYGRRSAPINFRPYLREKTVRRINRTREKEWRVKFKTKYELSADMLEEIAPIVPDRLRVFVMFDSWYASKDLIKLCREYKWHVICALKHNRNFNGERVSEIARRTRNKSFRPMWVSSAENSTRYWIRTFKGHINGLAEEVRVIISKRHPRDKSPEYFMCTWPDYPVRKVLSCYTQRWVIEVDHLYLKLRLGAEDFRVRSLEGICKHLALCFLSLAYLYWRMGTTRRVVKKLAEIIEEHRREHYKNFLAEFGRRVLAYNSVEKATKELLPTL